MILHGHRGQFEVLGNAFTHAVLSGNVYFFREHEGYENIVDTLRASTVA